MLKLQRIVRYNSTIVQGTVMKGINLKKNGADPIAKPDNEYPDWLWTLLDPEAQKQRLAQDPEKMARKEWRAKNRKNIRTANFLKSMS
ncbi:hypothetical protein CANCADRAFT_148366 [Tortispora caseinolytica NRRL Y-17796]|uniref:Large ribosomal subunit protein mL54 n=1 Tax=Tortispora caseinolytica NRRL Y-17796 TaxID=767744 RepID=A0A1E4TAG0_9ASCO|nr:hypothetical protein CANCADRAFT_148366 [Tortispora caseinolytica NRRL Y-17796]